MAISDDQKMLEIRSATQGQSEVVQYLSEAPPLLKSSVDKAYFALVFSWW